MADVRPACPAPLVDLVGIGFGPSNLAVAIAVSEHNGSVPGQQALTARFIERQPEFRPPEPADAVAAWELVANTSNLDDNSLYYYMIWFRDFADASLVATIDDAFIGFLTGYRRPGEPDVYFVWQEAVQPRHGIPDLGVKLFERAVERQVATGAKFVEASVSAANKSIIMVLRKLAKKYSAEIEKSVLFSADHFPGGHHDEILYRIGPLTAA